MSNNQFLPQRHHNFNYQLDYVGEEKTPVLIVDNFLEQAEGLLGFAAKYAEFRPGLDFYPGIQAKVPDFYAQTIPRYLGELICQSFALELEQINFSQSMYSMVLFPPAQLAVAQTRPHVDTVKANKIATVHYLCGAEKGGTSLYRHRATGFERLTQARMEEYGAHLETEAKDTRYHQQYICGSNDYYEEIARYEARFNRLLMYPGDVLHAPTIPADFDFSPSFSSGRLTLNTFIHLK